MSARHQGGAPPVPAPALAVKATAVPAAMTAVSANLPCTNVDLIPSADNIAVVDQATFCLVNQQRRAAGLVPLRENSRLDTSSQAHSDDMVSGDYFEHVTPSGVDPITRMFSVGYLQNNASWEAGENIAWGTLNLATPANIVNAWMNSPDHRANILNADFRDAGMGISPAAPASLGGGQAGATYTQDFGIVGG